MRVFISHSSQDKPAVLRLAEALEAAGMTPWVDAWEILPGDSIVQKINEGLEAAEAGVIVFSKASAESRWVEAEAGYLTYARIQEGKLLIPLLAEEGAFVPPLLRPLAWLKVEETDRIVAALHARQAPRPGVPAPELGRVERVVVHLEREGEAGVKVAVAIGGVEYGALPHPALPARLDSLRKKFLEGFRTGLRRDHAAAERALLEGQLEELGRELAAFCLPPGAGEALAELIQGSGLGTTVEVVFEAADPDLLGLPFEALLLPDGRTLALEPKVTVLRRPAGIKARPFEPLAGPLKILVAVGAPDEGQTASAVLDHERELQNILDAVEEEQRRGNAEVRILEVGSPEQIAEALRRDCYHVLHLSCHGMPGKLELEDEDGKAVPVKPGDLLQPLEGTGRPLPLVFLNSCAGGVEAELAPDQTASFAQALLGAGVPAVVAMQTSVSDFHATALARAFYQVLYDNERVLASRALAAARRELETERAERVRQGAPLREVQPEHATATLYVAGEEPVLANLGADKVPLRERPVHDLSGPVPQLSLDDLIGRRKELRETLLTLRDPERRFAGVVLTGIGGVGKSAVAGRAMRRLVESGFLVAPVVGRFDLQRIALALGTALLGSPRKEARTHAAQLVDPELDDRLRLQLLAKVLAEEPVVLVLDDFEQNLAEGGGAFLDPDVATYLGLLAENARAGRLLVTCRHPVPGAGAWLKRIPIGPLSLAESRKLLLRLPALAQRAPRELAQVLRVIGGHPRMLEFLDGVLRGGEGRMHKVTEKLREVLAKEGVTLDSPVAELEDALQQAVLLGSRDVLLQELVAITRAEGIEEVLLQAAVSNLPTSPAGLAHMLADGPADAAPVAAALERMEALSLVFRFPSGEAWVHRWTAEGLRGLSEEEAHRERCNRAGRYRWWRVGNETHDLGDAVEAVRNHLAGRDFDAASDRAYSCFDALTRFRQSAQIAALAGEVLGTLPVEHGNYAPVADAEAKAHLALGFTESALGRYEAVLNLQEKWVASEPTRDDLRRALLVTYHRVGDLYRDLAQGERAREAYTKALQLSEHFGSQAPDRVDDQRGLAVSHNKLGDLYLRLGKAEQARQMYQSALEICLKHSSIDLDRLDLQRDLAVSYSKMAQLHEVLGQAELAKDAYDRTLAIIEHLTTTDPERADYQRDLAAVHQQMGDLYIALSKEDKAQESYQQALNIIERLVNSEPDRVDYQRDLAALLQRRGDHYESADQRQKALEYFLQTLTIVERLASAEPLRSDHQHSLAIAYSRVADQHVALNELAAAFRSFKRALAVLERLATSEPERTDYQRDLIALYQRIGSAQEATNQREEAHQTYRAALAICERLVAGEPDRTDFLSVLAGSLALLGTSLGTRGSAHLERALAILQGLKSHGKLRPVDERKIQGLKDRLVQLD